MLQTCQDHSFQMHHQTITQPSVSPDSKSVLCHSASTSKHLQAWQRTRIWQRTGDRQQCLQPSTRPICCFHLGFKLLRTGGEFSRKGNLLIGCGSGSYHCLSLLPSATLCRQAKGSKQMPLDRRALFKQDISMHGQ